MFSLKRLGASAAGHVGFLDMYSVVRRAVTHSQATIIMYHYVNPEPPPWFPGAVKPEDFERQVAWLCKVSQIVSLDSPVNRLYEGKSIPPQVVCITFDDGYKDNYTFAYRILQKYNAPATIFLTTGYIESSETFWECKIRYAIWNTWGAKFAVEGLGRYHLNSPNSRLSVMRKIEAHLMKLPQKERSLLVERVLDLLDVDIPNNLGEKLTLSWEEVLEMSQRGISFGAHTVTHPILTQMPLEEAREEISHSKGSIEERIGQPCNLFAYPYGDFNAEIVRFVRESGFTAAVTTMPRLLGHKPEDPLLLSRIEASSNLYTLKGPFSGLYPDLMTALDWIKGRGHSISSG